MDFTQLSLPAWLFFALLSFLVWVAVVHWFAARNLERTMKLRRAEFDAACETFVLHCGTLDTERLERELIGTLRFSELPAETVLGQVLRDPWLARDDGLLRVWTSAAVLKVCGSLRRHSEMVAAAAPYGGLLGTILGISIAAASFSQSHDVDAFLSGISVALSTTWLGGLVSVIERVPVLLGRIAPLERMLGDHAFEVAIRTRDSLALNAASAPRGHQQRTEMAVDGSTHGVSGTVGSTFSGGRDVVA